MIKPFESFYYNLEVLTPVHIGGAKENDYMLGADYYLDGERNELVFFHQNQTLKRLSNQHLAEYTAHIRQNRMANAAELVASYCKKNPEIIIHRAYFPFEVQNEIKRHYSTALGKITIPGSSLKGSLRSIFGHYMIINGSARPNNNAAFDNMFGRIENNLMRFLQVTDVELNVEPTVFPMKIYSGDAGNKINVQENKMNYDGIGMWKHNRQGGHGADFNEIGFVTLFETCTPGAKGKLRLNWAKGLDDLIQSDRKPFGYKFYDSIKSNNWMQIAKTQTANFIEKERVFYDKFYNRDFDIVFKLLDDLSAQNNESGSVVLRLGAGSGYHAITGNWNYKDHTQTRQAEVRNNGVWQTINAIKYKTRKVAFGLNHDEEGEVLDFQLPGFVKISLQS